MDFTYTGFKETTNFNVIEIAVDIAGTIPNNEFEYSCMQQSGDRRAIATFAGVFPYCRKLAHEGAESFVHNWPEDLEREVLKHRQGWCRMPYNKSHRELHNPERKWFEFDGRTRHPACRLRGTRFSLIRFTSPCTGKLDFKSRAKLQNRATMLPHSRLRHNFENGCGVESGGQGDDAYPPAIGVISEEGCQRKWLNFEIGESLLISIMGERVVFRTTHC